MDTGTAPSTAVRRMRTVCTNPGGSLHTQILLFGPGPDRELGSVLGRLGPAACKGMPRLRRPKAAALLSSSHLALVVVAVAADASSLH